MNNETIEQQAYRLHDNTMTICRKMALDMNMGPLDMIQTACAVINMTVDGMQRPNGRHMTDEERRDRLDKIANIIREAPDMREAIELAAKAIRLGKDNKLDQDTEGMTEQ